MSRAPESRNEAGLTSESFKTVVLSLQILSEDLRQKGNEGRLTAHTCCRMFKCSPLFKLICCCSLCIFSPSFLNARHHHHYVFSQFPHCPSYFSPSCRYKSRDVWVPTMWVLVPVSCSALDQLNGSCL